MKPKYHSLNELVNMIDEPNKSLCYDILNDNKDLFNRARDSNYTHQARSNGYLDHITEIMNLAVVLYNTLDDLRPLSFSLSDSLLVLFLHDLEKPWRYLTDVDGSWKVNPKLADKETQVQKFVESKIKYYGFSIGETHWNDINYAEGAKTDYFAKKRTQNSLVAFIHMCDTWSARGWFNYPAESDDPWIGVERGKY